MNTDRIAFLNWLLWMRKASPELYALFKIKHPEIISALNDSRLGFSFDWGGLLDIGTKFVQTALPIYQQQKQFKQQLELAKLQLQAPAGFQQPQVAQPQYVPQVVSPSTPTTNSPVKTTNGQPVIEIRMEPQQVQEVKKTVEEDKILKYMPYMLGGAALLLFAMK